MFRLACGGKVPTPLRLNERRVLRHRSFRLPVRLVSQIIAVRLTIAMSASG